MRIGELLALRWSDIELTPPPERRDDDGWFPWLMVNGQIASKGKRVDYGKTHAAIGQLADYADPRRSPGVSPHSVRRTVATEIDEVDDAEAAVNQLGHTSKAVTERHHINRRLVVPDYRSATDRLAPGLEKNDEPTPGL